MPNLRETLDRLASGLASDIIAAIRDLPLSELSALTGRRFDVPAPEVLPAARPAKKVTTKEGTRRGRPPKKVAPTPALPDSVTTDAALAFFTDCGRKGATPYAVGEHLSAQGLAEDSGASAVVRVLVERGVIRDAGFRRTTAKGTMSVYVLAR